MGYTRKLIILSLIIFSSILLTTVVRIMGLQFPGVCLLPFLKIEVTFAIFHSAVTKPCRRDVLNKDVDASIITLFCFFKECQVNVFRSYLDLYLFSYC